MDNKDAVELTESFSYLITKSRCCGLGLTDSFLVRLQPIGVREHLVGKSVLSC